VLDRTIAGSVRFLPRSLVRRVAARYIAGVRVEEALDAVRRLADQGCVGTVDILGEHAGREEQALAAADAYEDVLRRLEAARLPAGVSVKPTALGLGVDRALCLAILRRLAGTAARSGRFVRVDMEESTWTSGTLELVREAHAEQPNVGAVIQARLRRSEDDLGPLIAERISVRLCKGIYLEAPEVAYTDFTEIRERYLRLLDRTLEAGIFVGIATHDPFLVEEALRLLQPRPAARYEFQMLMGVGEALRARLVAAGHRVRVYVPYGQDWYPYSVRRLQENPAIARQVAVAALVPRRRPRRMRR
jgi:proline dehydrogenase